MDDEAAPGLPDEGLSAQAEVASTQISGTKNDFTHVILCATAGRRPADEPFRVESCGGLA